ncbi:hypothetical protein [Nocardia gipuzkoensis]
MKKKLAELFSEQFAKSGLTTRELAVRVYGQDSESDVKTINRRLSTGSGLALDELPKFMAALQISPDELLRAVFSDLPDSRSLIIEKRDLEMRLHTLEERLAAAAGSTDLSVVEDIIASERWAVGVLPHMSGPAEDAEVLTGIRLAVTPSRPELLASGSTARSMFINDFGDILGDRVVFLGPTVRPVPRPPIESDPKDVVYLSVPVFQRDRKPSAAAVPLPRIGKSIAVTGIAQGAWCPVFAAIVARALGWGLENTSSIGRSATPVLETDRDAYIDAMNKVRNDGLRQRLLDPPPSTVLHHTGYPVVDSSGQTIEGHVLVDMVAAGVPIELPFIVLLSESDRMIEYQEQKVRRFDTGTPKFPAATWREWRDELRSTVEPIERQGRAMIIDIDLPRNPPGDDNAAALDPAAENRLLWQRTARHASKTISRLLDWGAVGLKQLPSNVDPDAERILKSLSLYR